MAAVPGIWRKAAPVEHGVWAFLCLPLVAALGHRPTSAGFVTALLILGGALAKRPMERALRGDRAMRTLAVVLGAILVTLSLALFLGTGFRALPFLALQALLASAAWLAGRRVGIRSLSAELLGACALLLGGASVLSAGGAAAAASLRFALALMALALPPLLVLRRQVARSSGRACTDPRWLPELATAAGLGVAILYWKQGYACPYLPIWSALLALRILPLPAPRRARTLGFAEGLLQVGHLCAALWALSPV